MEELLEVDEKTGVAYAREGAKRVRNRWLDWLFEGQYSLLTAYTTVVFLGTWWV